MDAFVANRTGHPNRVWLNDGVGGFHDSLQMLGDHNSNDVSLGDVDGDGDLDAVVANGGGHADRLWLNDGSGTFVDSSQALGDHNSGGVSLGDVDGDGDLDALIAKRRGTLAWLNDGSGRFTAAAAEFGANFGLEIALGDLDGDGDVDALVINTAGEPRLFFNQEPEVNVLGNGLSILDGTAEPRAVDGTDFGNQAVDQGTASQLFTIANEGLGPLTLVGDPFVRISGPHAADFTANTLPTSPIPGNGGTTTFEVVLDPSLIGLRTATVKIANYDLDEGEYEFAIQGAGVAAETPEIDVRGGGISISSGDATPSLSDATEFGNAAIATGMVSHAFSIANIGSADLNLDRAALIEISPPANNIAGR